MKFKVTISLSKDRLKESLIEFLGLPPKDISNFEIEYRDESVIVNYNVEYTPEHPDTICADEASKVFIR